MRNAWQRQKYLSSLLACLLVLANCNYSDEELKRRGFASDLSQDPANRERAYYAIGGGKNYKELEISIFDTETGRELKPETFLDDGKLKRGAREAGFEKMSVETLDRRKYTINLLAPEEPLKIEERK